MQCSFYENYKINTRRDYVGWSRLSDVAKTSATAASASAASSVPCNLRDAARAVVANCTENSVRDFSGVRWKIFFFKLAGSCAGWALIWHGPRYLV